MAPRKRSVVWSFFHILDEKKVRCRLCSHTILHCGHTTNMLKHMRSKHPDELTRAESKDWRSAVDDSEPMITTNGEYCDDVEIALEDEEHPEQSAAASDADITSAINGILKAAEDHTVSGDSMVVTEESHAGAGTPTRHWSSVWMHYERLENNRALCLLCMEKIQHRSSTSNLLRHLSKKHPEAFARLEGHKRQSREGQHTPRKDDNTKLTRKIGVTALKRQMQSSESPGRYSDVFEVMGACEGEVRVLERERELTEALRKAQQQEARALEQQRELLEALRRANAREASAEKEALESLKKAQEQEARNQQREREELQRERVKLQMEKEQVRREREELEHIRREAGQGRSPVMTVDRTGLFQGDLVQGQEVTLREEVHG